MMNFTRLFYLSIFVFLLPSCTTFTEMRRQLEASLPESERAYLIGKFSVSCEPNSKQSKCKQGFNSLSLYYEYLHDEKYSSRLNSTWGGMGSDTIHDEIDYDRKEKGYYFCRILPAGNYSILNMTFNNFSGGGSGYSLNNEDFFNLSFQLKTGQVTTIDHLKLTTGTGENIFGMSLPAPGKLIVSSLSEEKRRLAIRKCPSKVWSNEVISADLINNLPTEHPFVSSGD